LHQVNSAIEGMNLTTQENAAVAEESSAASQSLLQESVKLARLVGQFRISRSDGETPQSAGLMKIA